MVSYDSKFTLKQNSLDLDDSQETSQETNLVTLVKGAERYVFIYNYKNRPEILRTIGRFASNPELSLTWYDAACLSQEVRQERDKHEPEYDSDYFLY